MTTFGWQKICNELRKELNRPLPDGREFQTARDRRIQTLAHILVMDCTPPSLDGRNPRYFARKPIFLNHNCAGCNEGAEPCREGNYNRCSWPRARND